MASKSPLLVRAGLVERLDPRRSPCRLTWLIAPGGYGKSALIEAYIKSRALALDGRVAISISISDCESHEGLFVHALARELRGALPGVDISPLLAPVIREHDEARGWLSPALDAVLRSVHGAEVDLVIDEVERLAPSEGLTEVLTALAAALPEGLSLVLVGQARPDLGGAGHAARELGRSDLELTEEDVTVYLAERSPTADAAVARQIWEQTRGWPAMVELMTTAVLAGDAGALVEQGADTEDLLNQVVDRLLEPLRPEAQLLAKVAAIVGRFDAATIKAIMAAEVPGSASARRRVVRLPHDVVSKALRTLEERQLVVPAGDGTGGLALNQLLGRVLRERFRARDVDAYREVHRRAAELLLARGEGGVIAPFDLLLEAGEYERLLGLLESRAEALYQSGYGPQLKVWLSALATRYHDGPGWIDYYLGRVASSEGRWGAAREHLDRAEVRLAEGREAALQWRWQPRLCAAKASLLWRRGALPEASTWCRRGVDYIAVARRRGAVPEGGEQETRAREVELLALAARVAMEVSSYEKARAALETALEAASVEEFEVVRARILVRLARNALRGADLAAGERWVSSATEALRRTRDDEASAVLGAVSAQLSLLRGELSRAEVEATEALAAGRRAGRSAGLVRSYSALAAVAQARGDLSGALTWFERAEGPGERSGRADLRGELASRHALALLAAADPRAEAKSAEAQELLGPMVRLDGYLAGLHGELIAERRAQQERSPRNAIRYLEAARESLFRFGAEFDVARLHWRQAELHLRQVDAGDEEALEAVLAQLEDACVVAEERGLWLPDDRRRRELAVVGLRVCDEEVVAYCSGVLERLGIDPDALSPEDLERVAPFEQLRGTSPGGACRWQSRDGSGSLSLAEYESLVNTGEPGVLVALVDEQTLWNYGKRIDLGQKRIMLPLLLQFMRGPDEAYTMGELARSIWESSEVDGSVQTKVKVAISRLRSLLGKTRPYIITTRKPEGGSDVVAYRLAPGLAFKVVEPAL